MPVNIYFTSEREFKHPADMYFTLTAGNHIFLPEFRYQSEAKFVGSRIVAASLAIEGLQAEVFEFTEQEYEVEKELGDPSRNYYPTYFLNPGKALEWPVIDSNDVHGQLFLEYVKVQKVYGQS